MDKVQTSLNTHKELKCTVSTATRAALPLP